MVMMMMKIVWRERKRHVCYERPPLSPISGRGGMVAAAQGGGADSLFWPKAQRHGRLRAAGHGARARARGHGVEEEWRGEMGAGGCFKSRARARTAPGDQVHVAEAAAEEDSTGGRRGTRQEVAGGGLGGRRGHTRTKGK